jgi:hypothetical protein
LLEKPAIPRPSVVIELPVVGFKVVVQHTPFDVIDPPPSYVIIPPETALVWAIDIVAFVVSDGITTGDVVN